MSLALNNMQFGFFRILIILTIQVLVIKNIKLPWDDSGNFFFFPVIVMFLPSQLSKPVIVFTAFIIGLFVE